MTHASLLLILAGAALTYFVQGGGAARPLGRGERLVDDRARPAGEGRLPARAAVLGEARRLRPRDLPGDERPSGFASQVVVTDLDTGKSFPARIWMNTPLHHRGWSLFQSSYQQQGGREATVLSVSKDPGQLVVFAGYATLVLGMILVLLTRISQTREREAFEAKVAAGGMSLPTMTRSLLLVALALLPLASPARAAGSVARRGAQAAARPARRAGDAARHARPRDGLERDGRPTPGTARTRPRRSRGGSSTRRARPRRPS